MLRICKWIDQDEHGNPWTGSHLLLYQNTKNDEKNRASRLYNELDNIDHLLQDRRQNPKRFDFGTKYPQKHLIRGNLRRTCLVLMGYGASSKVIFLMTVQKEYVWIKIVQVPGIINKISLAIINSKSVFLHIFAEENSAKACLIKNPSMFVDTTTPIICLHDVIFVKIC